MNSDLSDIIDTDLMIENFPIFFFVTLSNPYNLLNLSFGTNNQTGQGLEGQVECDE
jgi:hypothetical protein